MHLALHKQAAHESQPVLLGRRNTQFIAVLGVVIAPDNRCRRIDQVAGVVYEIFSVSTVVVQRIVGVIRLFVSISCQIGAGVNQVKFPILPSTVGADSTQGIVHVVRKIVLHLQVTDRRIVGEVAVGLLHLTHDRRQNGPSVGQLQFKGAAALGLDGVVVLFNQGRIIENDSGCGERSPCHVHC